MTDQEIKDGFQAVYNGFWLYYKNMQLGSNSPMWDKIDQQMRKLGNQYPFLRQTIADLVWELHERMRGREAEQCTTTKS